VFDCRQLTRLEKKMSADIYMILEVLGQQQQTAVGGGGRPSVRDVGINTVPYYDIDSDTVL